MTKLIRDPIPRDTLAGLLVQPPAEDDQRTTVQMSPLRLEELLAPQRRTAVIPPRGDRRARRKRRSLREQEPRSYLLLPLAASLLGGVTLGLVCLWI